MLRLLSVDLLKRVKLKTQLYSRLLAAPPTPEQNYDSDSFSLET